MTSPSGAAANSTIPGVVVDEADIKDDEIAYERQCCTTHRVRPVVLLATCLFVVCLYIALLIFLEVSMQT